MSLMVSSMSNEAISKSPLNHSKSKQMYSFNKDKRFKMEMSKT